MAWLSSDGRFIVAARAVRTFAYGYLSVLLGVYLEEVGLAPWQIGTVLTATLASSAGLTVVFSLLADRYGRRRMLALSALLMAVAGAVFATASRYPIRPLHRVSVVCAVPLHAPKLAGRIARPGPHNTASRPRGLAGDRGTPCCAVRVGLAGRGVCHPKPDRLLATPALGGGSGVAGPCVLRNRAHASGVLSRRRQARGPHWAYQHDGVHPPAERCAADAHPRRAVSSLGDRPSSRSPRAVPNGRPDAPELHDGGGGSRRTHRHSRDHERRAECCASDHPRPLRHRDADNSSGAPLRARRRAEDRL